MTVGDDKMSVLLFVFHLKTMNCGYQCGIRKSRACCWRVHTAFHQSS